MNTNITVLVATAGQGVMRSSNGGQSWSRAGIDQGMHSDAIVRCLSNDPDTPQTLLAGTDKGLYRTPDAGRSWQLIDTPLSDYSVWNLTRNPRNPNVIYAGTGTPTPAALFKSIDRGESWEKLPVQVAETCPNVGIPRFTGLAVDPHDQDRIWAGIEVDGVRSSEDGGQTWRDVNGAISNKDVHSLAITAGPPKSVIVIVNNGSFTSQDDGHSWNRALAKDVFPLNYPRCITVKPGNPNTVFLGLGDFTPGRTGAILRSRDGGETWDNLPLPVEPNSAIWAFGTNPSNPQLIFAGSRYGYLYSSEDGGDSWSKEWREFSEIAAIAWLPS